MVGVPQPLDQKFPLVKPDGTPTDYFIRWAQTRQDDIAGGITAAQAQQLIADWAAARQIIAGRALDGGGFLSADVTIDHGESLVVPGTYGDSTHVPQFVVDQEGHVQGVVLVPIASGGGSGPMLLPYPVDEGVGFGTGSSTIGCPVLEVKAAYCQAATSISKLLLPLHSTLAGTSAIPVIYDFGAAVGASVTVAGAALVASGPPVALTTAPKLYSLPFTTPFVPTVGHVYYLGFCFFGATGNITLAALGSTQRVWFNATAFAAAPAVLPAMTSATGNNCGWWGDS